MSESVEAIVRSLLGAIAADADMSTVAVDDDLREKLDIDSMDLLHFAVALTEAFGIDVPEADYARLSTIANTVAYVAQAGGPASADSIATEA